MRPYSRLVATPGHVNKCGVGKAPESLRNACVDLSAYNNRKRS